MKHKYHLLLILLLFNTAKAQYMGVNLNEQFEHIDFEKLEYSQTQFVRGFVDFFQFQSGNRDLNTDEKILKYIQLKENGYRTVLNIKWNFAGKDFPAVNSNEMDQYKTFLKTLLNRVWPYTDYIVVGNEPFIESKKEQRITELNQFYQAMAKEVRDYRDSHKNIPIYIGSFSNLYEEGDQTPGVNNLLAFAKANDWLAGIDLHIHHHATQNVSDAFDYVNDKIRDDQKIIVSEFSLKKHFKSRQQEAISSEFANQYGYDATMQNYQYFDYALKNPRPKTEWVDFLSKSYWFENRKLYLSNIFELFKTYDKFFLATYAIRQSYVFGVDFTATTDPWILNGLYANRTVETDSETGKHQVNYAWMDDFHTIQAAHKFQTTSINDFFPTKNTILKLHYSRGILELPTTKNVDTYFLYNMSGQKLMELQQKHTDISSLPKGIYCVAGNGKSAKFSKTE